MYMSEKEDSNEESQSCLEMADALLADLQDKEAPEEIVSEASALRDSIAKWYEGSGASEQDYSKMDSKGKEKMLKKKGIIVSIGQVD